MQFSESWLRSFCNPPLNTQQLSDTLTMAGFEVEECVTVAPLFSKVVVGEIKEAAQHPNADRLRVCQVDVGADQCLNIVCGAPNARVGIKVPCALVGAELPPDAEGKTFKIKLGKLRGVESQGMLCSAKELGLSDESSGLLELSDQAPVGMDVREHLDLDDHLLTLKLTPNLGHALSVYGVARELSALTGAPLMPLSFPVVNATLNERLPVHIQDADLCGRFGGRIIRNVNPQAKTPSWMVQRLERCGQRSVSALVDISNYVMFELGRPSHMFDLEKIHGSLTVRWAKPGETLKLLNGNTVTLQPQIGVIADEQCIESMAGIMGGDATAVGDETRHVYVEAAFWWPQAIAGKARLYGFSTDASHRFERGVDPHSIPEHLERLTQLILDICGTPETQCGVLDDQIVQLPEAKKLHLRVARAEKVIGMPVSAEQCQCLLQRLGLNVQPSATQTQVLEVDVPSYRFDLNIEADLIEEIVRLIGYDHLPHTPVNAPTVPQIRAESRRDRYEIRRTMASLGYQETINYSFVDERWEVQLLGNANPIRLLNPIASHMGVMRSGLWGSLLQAVKFNVDRRVDRMRLFEIGRVFKRDDSVTDSYTSVAGISQPLMLAGAIFGRAHALQWGERERAPDFYDIKGDVEALLAGSGCAVNVNFQAQVHPSLHPGRSAAVYVDGQKIGWVGELHPQWKQFFELNAPVQLFELDLHAVLTRVLPSAQAISKLQSVQRDLAFVMPEALTFAELRHTLLNTPEWGKRVQDVLLFDVFRAQAATVGAMAVGEKSLALRLTLQNDMAWTDVEIEAALQAMITHVTTACANVRLR